MRLHECCRGVTTLYAQPRDRVTQFGERQVAQGLARCEAAERLAEIKRLKALAAGKPAPKAPPPPLPQPVVAKVEVPKINVTTVTRKVLMIGDRTKIPHYVDNAAGVRYWLLIPDEARIKDAIKAGFVVPGCSIVEEEGTRQR